MTASAYHVISKEVKNHIFRHNWIFRDTRMYKQPILKKQWNYNILCKYYIVISNLLFQIHWYALSCMFSFCCSLQYYQNFMRNQYGIKIKLQKKAHKIICVRSINFLIARPLFIIYYFICLLPPPSQVINLLNRPYKNVWFCHGWCSVWW